MPSPHSRSPYNVPTLHHVSRHLKFVIPGALITIYFGTHNEIIRIVSQGDRWARTVALASLALGITTVALFLYMLAIPLIHGQELNYRAWRESRFLSTVIPILTASILVGWSLLVLTFGQFSNLGYVAGGLRASGLYALAFGLMGLIPAPRARRL